MAEVSLPKEDKGAGDETDRRIQLMYIQTRAEPEPAVLRPSLEASTSHQICIGQAKGAGAETDEGGAAVSL